MAGSAHSAQRIWENQTAPVLSVSSLKPLKLREQIAPYLPSPGVVLPTVLFLVALLIRLPAIPSALPYTHSWDEPFVVNPALRIIKTGDWNPHFQIYPGGFIYLQTLAASAAAVQMAGTGELAYTTDLRSGLETKYLWTISHPKVYLFGRFLAALLGALTAVVVWRIGRLAYGPVAGVVSGFLVAVSPLAVSQSTIIGTDSPATLFMMLALLASAGIVSGGSGRLPYLAAGISVGVAVGMKYNAGIVLLAVVVAHLLRPRAERRAGNLAVVLAAMIGAFLLTSPYALLDYAEFMKGIVYSVRHYTYGSHNAHGLSRMQNMGAYLTELRTQGSNTLVFATAILGVAAGLALRVRRAHLVFVLFFAVYLWYFAGQKVRFVRLVLPVLPVLLLFAGAAVEAADLRLRRWKPKWRVPSMAVVLAIVLAPLAVASVRQSVRKGSIVDSRQEAMNFLRSSLPADARVALDPNLHFYLPADLGTGIREVSVLDKTPEELINSQFEYAVIARDYGFRADSFVNKEVAARLNSRFAGLPVVREFGTAPLEFGTLPISPGVRICRLSGGVPPPVNQDGLAGLTMSTHGQAIPDFDSGAMQLWGQGRLFANVKLSRPVASLQATMSGNYAAGSFPQVRITLRPSDTTSSTVVTPGFFVTGYNSYPTTRFPCKLPAGDYRVDLEYLNGATVSLLEDVNPRFLGVKYLRFE